MINWDSAADVYREIDNADKFKRTKIAKFDEQIEKYTGPFYDQNRERYDQENFAYSYLSWMLPQMVFSSPRVRVGTRRQGENEKQVALAIEHGLSRWVSDVNLRDLLVPVVTDSLFNFGVMLVTMEENDKLRGVQIPDEIYSSKAAPLRPTVQRVSQDDFGIDPAARSWSTAQYKFHKWRRVVEDLMAEAELDPKAGWHKEAIEGMTKRDGSENAPFQRPNAQVPDRGDVEAWEIWVPGYQLEKDDVPWDMGDEEPTPEYGYNGTLFTLAVRANREKKDGKGADSAWIRDPIPYFGPPTGPYTMFGIYPVPNEVYPLGPITAVQSQVDELNRIDQAMSQSMQDWKRPLVYDEKNLKMAAALKNAQHNQYVGIPGFKPEDVLTGFEIGGVTEQQIIARNDRRNVLYGVSGFDEQQRGRVGAAGATATAVAEAAQNANARVEYIKEQNLKNTADVIEKVAWYLFHEEEVVFLINVGKDIGVPGKDAWFQGGDTDPESGTSFYDLELSIEPYSMERTNEGLHQRRVLEMHQLIMGSFQMIMMFPDAFPWSDWFNAVGDAMNIPGVGDMLKVEKIQEAATRGLQSGDTQARLSGDAKGVPQLQLNGAQNAGQMNGADMTRGMFGGR